jgi:hypothetical protein
MLHRGFALCHFRERRAAGAKSVPADWQGIHAQERL